MSTFRTLTTIASLLWLIWACNSEQTGSSDDQADTTDQTSSPSTDFMKNLTFYASFDGNLEADFAKGDKSFYTAPSRKQLDEAQAGLHNADHAVVEGEGRFGNAFRFGRKSDTVVFYKAQGNIAYDSSAWSGTISFWLRVDPENELAPGYTDPIQITDVRYNDASIWVDFTKEEPRDFRLGVFGDLAVWSKDTLKTSNDEEFERRTVRVKNPPFSSDDWTHIMITYEQLGNAQSLATLYVNAQKQGTVEGIDEPYTWELEKANIYLGLSFIGMMDELAIFDRPFTEDEVKEFNALEKGLSPFL